MRPYARSPASASFARRRERRRIAHHQIEAFPRQLRHRLERIATPHQHPLRHVIQRCRLLRRRQGRRAAVHQRHLACPCRRAADPERAHVAEHVQHPRVLRQCRYAIAVWPLIEEPPGLLPLQRIDWEPHATLNHFGARIFAKQKRDLLGKPLLPTSAQVIPCHHRAQWQQTGQRFHNQRRQPIHRRRVRLHHRHFVVSIDHQARQPVSLGMHEPVERRIADALPQRDRLTESRLQPRHIDHRRRITIEQPRRDQTVRIEHERAEPGAIVALDPHQPARRHLPIFGLHRDLVGEHPGRPGPQPPPLSCIQPQYRTIQVRDPLAVQRVVVPAITDRSNRRNQPSLKSSPNRPPNRAES